MVDFHVLVLVYRPDYFEHKKHELEKQERNVVCILLVIKLVEDSSEGLRDSRD